MTESLGQMNVAGAFELLVEALEDEVNAVNVAGGRAFERGDYATVNEHLAHAGAITALRGKVLALRGEWDAVMPAPDEDAGEEGVAAIGRRDLGRLPKGVRTPERHLEVPILQALEALGGRARMADVLDKVGEIMRDTLTEADYQPLPSDPDSVRWRNTAQWARFTLVQQGDMSPSSPRGVWEITEQGRRRAREAS